MTTPEYQQRHEIFEGHVAAGREILRYQIESPHHPYLDELDEYLEHAVLGILDRNAGRIYADGIVNGDTVVITPVLQADIAGAFRTLEYTVAGQLHDTPGYLAPSSPLGHMDAISAQMSLDDGRIGEIMFLSPNLPERHELQRGTTVTHELDHIYWARHERERLLGHNVHSLKGRALLELSAYDLDSRFYEGYDPDTYNRVWDELSRRMQYRDFANEPVYQARGNDKYLKSMRNTAFISVMFHYLGMQPGVVPTRRGVQAMKHQGLI